MLPLAVAETWVAGPPSIHLEDGALVAYLGVGCSALTYVLWGYALRNIEAGRAAIFDSLIPVVGVATAVLVLQEAPLAWHLIGGMLVVAGVWLALCEPKCVAMPAAVDASVGGDGWDASVVLERHSSRPAAVLT